MLSEQQSHALAVSSRTIRGGIDEDVDIAALPGRDHHQAQAQPSAQLPHVAAVHAGACRAAGLRASDGEVHAVGQREPIDTLEQEREIERELQFDDHGRLVAACCDDVAPADLALHIVALTLEKRFDRRIEIGFAARLGFRSPEHAVYYA
jgi:hypothetical protein